MRTLRTLLLCIVSAALAVAPVVRAQQIAPPPGVGQPGAQARAERQLRQRIAQIVQKRLALTNDQMARLGEVNRRYEPQMQETFQRERRIRRQLQVQLTGPDSSVDQQLVDRLMGEFLKVQRDRLDVIERENRELAAFLTPVQRVKLFEMREQIRRRVEEQRRDARARRQDGAGPPAVPF